MLFRSCNVGISLLNGEPGRLLWILNNDTIVDRDCLQLLTAAIQSGECEIAVPTIIDGHSKTVWYAGGHWDQRRGWTVHHQWGQPEEDVMSDGTTELISGCSFLAKASTLTSLRGFDESFFMYCEDVDLSIRASRSGLVTNHIVEIGRAHV